MGRLRLLTVLICTALVAVRTGGTHLHLCLDGQDPQVSIHIGADSEWQNLSGLMPFHQDYEFDLIGNGVADPSRVALPLVALWFAFFLLSARLRVPRASTSLPSLLFSPSPKLRPPLRGPPASLPQLI